MKTQDSFSGLDAGRRDMARSAGLAAFVYGYPLVESVRTCRLQTGHHGLASRAPLNTLHSATRPSTDQDRDVVTPANDLLYTTAWIHLGDGPCVLTVPAAAEHPGRYFVLALYDAYTENFENLGPRNCSAQGEQVLLLGPGQSAPAALSHLRQVACPTHLVWLISRILVGDEADQPAARALQATIRLAPAEGTGPARAPASVAGWEGEPVDAMADMEAGVPAEDVARRFFGNLCRALSDAPGRPEDQGLIAWFGQAGLRPGSGFDWALLDAPVREGLLQGFVEAIRLVGEAARSRKRKPWVLAGRAGRYGHDYLTRALTAYIGLGALATTEALYAAGHFAADGQALDGSRRHLLRFEADALPPADAFWSVTLYDADRFLYPNAIGRHAIGDRTPGLRREVDGSLQLIFSHDRPADAANWLPTPAGRFYLILRLYHPRQDVRQWRIPALQPLEGKA
ncbi:DUF1254 domain-containing protein [uncultured Pseudacidovorax sp.]|uniref:DUF1254 domain-containing protein n=1 Tax=uncultured Pseudacidovorax sp. TaxID=679313 RepID=UPI0025E1E051|nr:DUF1254 domain-containing protein [uncultured Pseudacidovorax sp.]